jgi:hypothetical protein
MIINSSTKMLYYREQIHGKLTGSRIEDPAAIHGGFSYALK